LGGGEERRGKPDRWGKRGANLTKKKKKRKKKIQKKKTPDIGTLARRPPPGTSPADKF